MEIFSTTTRTIAQEGRRGALMLSLDIDHDDAVEFITAKDDLSKITGANISVKVTDEFMEHLDEDKNQQIWLKLIHQAWKTAEPGILFWDRIIKESPADCYEGFKTIATNPCSELPLCAYDSCRLSALNIYAYVINPFTLNSYFDFESFKDDVKLAQRLMDDIIDLEHEKVERIIAKIINDPEPLEVKKVELDLWSEIHNKLMIGRRTGLGQMGLADAGAALGLKYADNKFIEFASNISQVIALNSYKSSIDLAEERGCFIKFDRFKEKDNPFIKRILNSLPMEYLKKYDNFGRRNIANLTIAPTGSISTLAGVTSGIEPVYALQYTRRRKVSEDNPNKKYQDKQGDWWEEYTILHPKLYDYAKMKGCNIEHDHNMGILRQMVAIESPYYKSTAYEIDNSAKVRMQGEMQAWIDHGISVTYNLPKTATEEDISNLYLLAWKSNCKGLTVYRDGCREGILRTSKPGDFNQHDAPKRPKDLLCDIYNIVAKGRSWKVIIGLMDNYPYEVFAVNGLFEKINAEHGILRKVHKGRYDLISLTGETLIENITANMTPDEEVLTRVISWALRHGSKLEFGIKQLNESTGDITSFSKAISRVLKKYLKDGLVTNNTCPNCGSNLISEGGCLSCRQCNFSKCE
jgi:ribonucleoside-diphosphate reductase alpha chain